MCTSGTGNKGLSTERVTREMVNELKEFAVFDEAVISARLACTSLSRLGRWNCHSLQKLESCSRNPTV